MVFKEFARWINFLSNSWFFTLLIKVAFKNFIVLDITEGLHICVHGFLKQYGTIPQSGDQCDVAWSIELGTVRHTYTSIERHENVAWSKYTIKLAYERQSGKTVN